MTDLFGIIVALLLLGPLWSLLVGQVRRAFPGVDGVALAHIVSWALGLRVLVALVLNLSFAFGERPLDIFWGDSGFYDEGAWLKARRWSGEAFVGSYDNAFATSGYGWLNTISVVYYVFGRNQLLVQFLNAILGVLTVIAVFDLTRRLYDAEVAQQAARFTAYFPQMVIWSAGMYKDPAILLTISVSILAVTRLRERFTARWLFLFLAAALWLLSLRFYVFYFLAAATVGTFVIGQKRGFFGSLLAQGVLVVAFLATVSAVVGSATIDQQMQMFDLVELQRHRLDMASSASSGFGADADISTPAGALSAMPLGALYLLFAPFPWAVSGVRQALTIPEMLYWYWLMPSFLRGLRWSLRNRFGPSMPMLVFALSLTLAYSVMQANAGTAYRQRTQIAIFFFVLMAAGQAKREPVLRGSTKPLARAADGWRTERAVARPAWEGSARPVWGGSARPASRPPVQVPPGWRR